MTTVTKKVRQFERRYLPNQRKKTWYKFTKAAVLLPIVVLPFLATITYRFIIKKMRFKRKGKPDIVLQNIIDGWSNFIFGNPEVEKLAIKRAGICAKCPFAVTSGIYSITTVDQRTKQVQGMRCAKCGCALSAKVRAVNDSCPLGKW